jgi:Protein of unknown function DUF2625
MRHRLLILIITFIPTLSYAQTMRPITDLINTTDPGWPLVQEWVAAAKNKVEILPVDTTKAKAALYNTQVTTRSPMGAIVCATGGILVDDGWIRILGSGCDRLTRNLPEWNKGKSFKEYGEPAPFYLIADDAVGGFFAINGGGLGKDPGKVYYLAPDTLEWEEMDWTYSDFLLFCFSGDLQKYYEDYRWKGWRAEVAAMSPDKTMNFFPPLFSKEGKDMKKASRKPVPVEEQYSYTLEMRRQLGIK